VVIQGVVAGAIEATVAIEADARVIGATEVAETGIEIGTVLGAGARRSRRR